MNRNDKYLTLVRREIWEHRSLWMLPLIGAGLLLVSTLFGQAVNTGVDITIRPGVPAGAEASFGAVSSVVIFAVIGLFACIVGFFYLLDCLFAERKDRSILFWKSLPVSDAETVLTKLSVALVLLPLFVLVLGVLLQPLLAGIVALRVPQSRPMMGELLGGSFAALPHLIGIGIFAILWYAPVAAYMMLASVLARRAPVVYAIVPPLALGVAERLLLGSQHVFGFVGDRLMPWPERARHLFAVTAHDGDGHGIATVSTQWWKLFADVELWLGVAVAVAIAGAVIRLRRYRDDT